MNTLQPDDIQIHFEFPELALPDDLAAIDTEFFGQDKEKLHRPHGTLACAGVTYDGKNVYMVFDPKQIEELYNRINPAIHVYHNAQYDIRQLREFAPLPDRKKVWDTMLVDQIRFMGYYGGGGNAGAEEDIRGFSLADLSRRYLDLYLDKSERETFEAGTRIDDEQIFYAAKDIVATWYVAKAQRDAIDDDDLGIWQKIERPFLWTLLDTKGVGLDVEGWRELTEENQRIADEIDENLPFNPRSHTQVKDFVKKQYKITLNNTQESTLIELAESNPEVIEVKQILEGRAHKKLASTYGQSWLDAVEADGRIYPAYWQIGAGTGRMSAKNPPIQTTPHLDKSIPLNKQYRSKIIATPGNVLAIADYSSQEPRILAHVTQDKTLIDIFQSKKDIYIEIGYQVFGERFDKKDPRRNAMKTVVLGVSYGMWAGGLARKLDIEQEEAQGLLDTFFHKFPGIAEWADECDKYKPYAQTIYGRKFWLNPYQNGWERNARNHPMQGSAVDCTKIASANLRKELGFNPIMIYMHDELVCEFPKKDIEDYKEVMKKCMVEAQEAMHPQIPGGIEMFIGPSWASKE